MGVLKALLLSSGLVSLLIDRAIDDIDLVDIYKNCADGTRKIDIEVD